MMKRNNEGLKNRSGVRSIALSVWAKRVAVGSLAVMLGLAAVGTPPRAVAAPVCAASILQRSVTVYLFDANDTPVPAPDAYIYEGGVYTDCGFIGMIDADFDIVDSADNILGYLTYPSPG